MELKDLAGQIRLLSGVTNETISLECSWDDEQLYDGNSISFILDGVTYTAIEDNNDGYRSAMDSLLVNKYECKNIFKPIPVFCVYRTKAYGGYNSADLLDIYEVENGNLILTLGTDNSDDYYPSFVTDWQPENISAS